MGAQNVAIFSHISTAHYWYPLARSRASPILLVEGGRFSSVVTDLLGFICHLCRAVVSRPPYIVGGGGREGGAFPSPRAVPGGSFSSFSLFYSMCVWAASYGRWGTVVGGGDYGRGTVVWGDTVGLR